MSGGSLLMYMEDTRQWDELRRPVSHSVYGSCGSGCVKSVEFKDWSWLRRWAPRRYDDTTIRLPAFHLPQWRQLVITVSAGPLRHVSNEMGSDTQWNVWHPDNVAHYQFLPADQIWRRRSTSTHCRRGCCWLADVIRHLEAYVCNSALIITHVIGFAKIRQVEVSNFDSWTCRHRVVHESQSPVQQILQQYRIIF